MVSLTLLFVMNLTNMRKAGMIEQQGQVCCAQVTCFSNSEEDTVGKSDIVPFMPEKRLSELGGLYEKVSLTTVVCCSALSYARQLNC